MDAGLESKIVQPGWLNLANWAQHSISGMKIQQALFGITHPSKIKNILSAHMHTHVCSFQRAGNASRLLHQILHIYPAQGTSLKLCLHQDLCSKHRGRGMASQLPPPSPLQALEVHSKLKITRAPEDIWTEPATWDEIWSGPNIQPEQTENAKLGVLKRKWEGKRESCHSTSPAYKGKTK